LSFFSEEETPHNEGQANWFRVSNGLQPNVLPTFLNLNVIRRLVDL